MGNRPRRKATGNPADPEKAAERFARSEERRADEWVTCRKVLIEELVHENADLRARLAAVEALCVPHDHGHTLPIDPGSCFRCEVRAAARGEDDR